MQLKNEAAWIPQAKAQLDVQPAPYSACGDDEVVIENYVVAINPVDWKIQSADGFGLKYPNILGSDVAGEIIEVGSNVTRLRKGQRVLGHALGLTTGNPANGAFQLYSLLNQLTVAPIPDSLSFESASVLPLSLSTAAAGLYPRTGLNLRYPSTSNSNSDPPPTFPHATIPRAILVWGGSSSVGSSVIQLARATGLVIATTASPSNFDYVRSLGAAFVFDYHDSKDAVEKLIEALSSWRLVGAYDAIGTDSTVKSCAKVVHEMGGGTVVSVVSAPKDVPGDVEVARVSASSIASKEPEVAKAIYDKFVPDALAKGILKAKPDPIVVGTGLEKVQAGLDRQKKGVSARKVVVQL